MEIFIQEWVLVLYHLKVFKIKYLHMEGLIRIHQVIDIHIRCINIQEVVVIIKKFRSRKNFLNEEIWELSYWR